MQKSLTENTQFAKLYSSMQNEFMAAKDKLLTVYENALLTANGLKDKKEVGFEIWYKVSRYLKDL